MGELQTAHVTIPHDYGKARYKTSKFAHIADGGGIQQQYYAPTILPYRIIAVAIGVMVSALMLARLWVAFTPLKSIVAQYATASQLPLLLDATAEELTLGLENGDFTSLDLVNVGIFSAVNWTAREGQDC